MILKDGDGELQKLPSGKEITKKYSDDDKTDKNKYSDDVDDVDEENIISFTKDILPYVVPLSCILTMKI